MGRLEGARHPVQPGDLIFTFLLLVDKIFDLTDLIINKGVPVHLVLQLLGYILPAFLVLTIPIGFLLAILVAFGRLSADMEVVALKASRGEPPAPAPARRGVRARRARSHRVPDDRRRAQEPTTPSSPWCSRSSGPRRAVGLKERLFNDTFGSFVIYVDEIATDQVALRQLFVSDERRPDESRFVTAKEGRLLSPTR